MLILFIACTASVPESLMETTPSPVVSTSKVDVRMQFEPLPWPKEGRVLEMPVPLEKCLNQLPSCQCFDAENRICVAQFVSEISEIPHLMMERIRETSWQEGCPIPLEDLRLLRVLHWTEKQEIQWGEMILTHRIVSEAEAVFRQIYQNQFPIHSMKPALHYAGSDDESMEDNNTSAFNCRKVKGSNRWSEHSYGEAIDINPVWNPWVKGSRFYPKNAEQYIARDQQVLGMINEGDAIIAIFEQYGWQWGSQKAGIRDYQHFSRKDHTEVYGDK